MFRRRSTRIRRPRTRARTRVALLSADSLWDCRRIAPATASERRRAQGRPRASWPRVERRRLRRCSEKVALAARGPGRGAWARGAGRSPSAPSSWSPPRSASPAWSGPRPDAAAQAAAATSVADSPRPPIAASRPPPSSARRADPARAPPRSSSRAARARTPPPRSTRRKAIVESGRRRDRLDSAPPPRAPHRPRRRRLRLLAPTRQPTSIAGAPAGPAAIAVARDFADAFVVYETGGSDGRGAQGLRRRRRRPELAKALLQRPPRLPANVKVPKAKVLNVVPGPSHGSVYPVSVSLLRVGVTSELRLEMEQLKDEGWRVTNVLG